MDIAAPGLWCGDTITIIPFCLPVAYRLYLSGGQQRGVPDAAHRCRGGRLPGPPQPAPASADYRQIWRLDSIALFRYSALTFNGHRIHYDADYARDVEGYPNLVIHGPLLATLLLDLYARQGRPPARFRYQARSPLCLPHPFTLGGQAGTPARLWAADHTGNLAMEAAAVEK